MEMERSQGGADMGINLMSGDKISKSSLYKCKFHQIYKL